MLHIIYSEHTHRILDYVKKRMVSYPFIWVGSHIAIDKEMLYTQGIKEHDLYEPSAREKIDNEQEYIATISMLSSMCDPIEWWAHSISEKNEHLSYHYKNVVQFCYLIKILRRHSDNNRHILVIGNKEIFNQLKEYCSKNCIKILSLENPAITCIKEILGKSRFYLSVLMLYIRTVWKKLYVDYVLGKSIKKEINNNQGYYVIRTRFDTSFLTKEGCLPDALFGNLPYYALERGYKVLILARIPDACFFKIVRKIKDIKNFLIIPEDYFLGYSDFSRLQKYLYLKSKKLSRNIVFDGIDVTNIYQQEIDNSYFTADYLRNILSYFIAKRFAEKVNFKTYVQAYENYAWEKLTILGIRESKRNCKILGFQHSFITRNSFKYFLGDIEREKIPLPDKIITIGTVTRGILERYGGYNKDIFMTGCALRQEYIANQGPFKRRYFRRIVVPLTMAKDEAILILRFLCDSGLPGTKNTVVIRPHPGLPFEKIEKEIKFRIPDNFIIINQRSVKEELSESDMVLYTWSTVAVEALRLGVPVVYLDILKPMYVDPLFECSALKRTVAKKEELLLVIENIYTMPDEAFYKEQQIAQEYLKGYFYPVNSDTLEPFLT